MLHQGEAKQYFLLDNCHKVSEILDPVYLFMLHQLLNGHYLNVTNLHKEKEKTFYLKKQ